MPGSWRTTAPPLRARHLAVALVVLLVVGLGAGAVVQWVRPLPAPTLTGLTTPIRVPGTAPSPPWPTAGAAALSVPGVGGFAKVSDPQPVPMAGLAGVFTAYVVLKDHPLRTGGVSGPTLSVSPQLAAAAATGDAAGEPEVTVTAGESLTELDALEGLLVDSGNDMATLLADWDAGSTSAFVAKMNLVALSLGLHHTHITDPSGADPGTVSTPGDLLVLGQAAMRVPVFSQIVSLGETNLPGDRLRYNPDFDLGRDGIVGMVASSDTPSNGCFLFAAQSVVGGHSVTLYGVVLGQAGPEGPDTAAVDAGDACRCVPSCRPSPPSPCSAPDRSWARRAPRGRVPVPVVVSGPIRVGWPGLDLRPVVYLGRAEVPVAAGTSVGVMAVGHSPLGAVAGLRTTGPLRAPSAPWRLTR